MAMLLGAWYIPIVVTAGGSIWSFFQGKLSEEVTFFPEDDDETLRDATVRIWAGMTSKRSDSAAINPHGFMPHAILYDERGEMTGKSCGRRRFVKEGDFQDIKIPARGGHNARPGYLELIAWSNDAICISAIRITYPDGGSAMIYGDVPFGVCGWQGFQPITEVPLEGSGPGYKPFCFWLDADDSYGEPDPSGVPWVAGPHKPVSVTFHLPDFNGNNETTRVYDRNHDLLCKSSGRMQGHPWKPRTIAIFEPPLTYGDTGVLEPGVEPPKNFLDPKFVLDSEVTRDGTIWPQSEWVRDTPLFSDGQNRNVKKGDESCGYFPFKNRFPGNEPAVDEKKKRSEDSVPYGPQPLAPIDAPEDEETTVDDLSEPDDDDDNDEEPLTGVVRPLKDRFADEIFVSSIDDDHQSAESLCSMSNAIGPNFVNTFEGKYCDMTTRQVWPICGGDITASCFRMEDMTLLGARPAQPAGAHGSSLLALAMAAPILKKFARIRGSI